MEFTTVVLDGWKPESDSWLLASSWLRCGHQSLCRAESLEKRCHWVLRWTTKIVLNFAERELSGFI